MQVFDRNSELQSFLRSRRLVPIQNPKRVMMVSPYGFDIKYAINPHMSSKSGTLHLVDKKRAVDQWQDLNSVYRQLGYEVETLEESSHLPDMVFAANHALVWKFATNEVPQVLMGRMRSNQRQGEIELFEPWYRKNGYEVHHLSSNTCFEGNGDALLVPSLGLILGGYGPRTDKEVYDEICSRFGLPIVRVELIGEDFYHLDTCLSVLNATTIVFYPKAVAPTGRDMLHALFKNVIELDDLSAKNLFTGNCHSPEGKHIICQKGSDVFMEHARSLGFECLPVDTSEFIKAGGSVFCLKMMVY